MSQTFQRRPEDFICERCGKNVSGNGYTNHCPECLTSKHVDVFPGDRAELCGGLMPAVGWETHKGETIIVHRCEQCGIKRKNVAAINDLLEPLFNL